MRRNMLGKKKKEISIVIHIEGQRLFLLAASLLCIVDS